MPLFFLGVGIYRAWIELVYVRPLVDFPTWRVAGHDVFDIAMSVTLLICAALAHRLVPLSQKRWALWGAGVLMVAGTIPSFVSVIDPDIVPWAAYPAAIAAGVGAALIILLWSEFYGCLNITRVALYYPMSLLFGAFIVFIMKGFVPGYAAAFSIVLPVLSVICVAISFRAIAPEDQPKRAWGRFAFPWKPVALMAVYAFAFGMRETALYTESGPHSSWGVLFASVLVIGGVISQSDRFDLSIIYRIGLPLMVGGLLLVPLITNAGAVVSNFCVSASYASFSILIMLILSNITHSYGVGAVWLFGIERGLRSIVMWLGRLTSDALAISPLSSSLRTTIVTMSVLLLVVVCTMILMSERELSSRWGVALLGVDDSDEQALERNRLANLCATLAADHQLSPREAEILQLLAERKTVADIQARLYISKGTAKAHIAHIYRKMDLHARHELFELLGLE